MWYRFPERGWVNMAHRSRSEQWPFEEQCENIIADISDRFPSPFGHFHGLTGVTFVYCKIWPVHEPLRGLVLASM